MSILFRRKIPPFLHISARSPWRSLLPRMKQITAWVGRARDGEARRQRVAVLGACDRSWGSPRRWTRGAARPQRPEQLGHGEASTRLRTGLTGDRRRRVGGTRSTREDDRGDRGIGKQRCTYQQPRRGSKEMGRPWSTARWPWLPAAAVPD